MVGSSALGVRASRRIVVLSLAIVAATSGSYRHGERVESVGILIANASQSSPSKNCDRENENFHLDLDFAKRVLTPLQRYGRLVNTVLHVHTEIPTARM
jgi:hypothetical protein